MISQQSTDAMRGWLLAEVNVVWWPESSGRRAQKNSSKKFLLSATNYNIK